MKTFIGWDGGDKGNSDELTLGTLEGGSAPCLHIRDVYGNCTGFTFISPEQVSEFIEALRPFGKE